MTQHEYREAIDSATIKIAAWMVAHGAVDTEPDPHDEDSMFGMMMELRMMYLDDLECFIGGATCDPVEPAHYATDKELIVEYEHEVPHHNLEIAALVPLVSPVSVRDLEAIVDELNPGVVDSYVSALPDYEDSEGGNCEKLSVAIDEDRNTWVVRRLRFDDIDGPDFDSIMSEFVALARTTCKRIWEHPNS